MLKPQTTKQKITIGAIVIGAFASFTTVGGAILMWEDLRPWMSELEEKEMRDRACEAKLWTIQSDLFRQQATKADALESLSHLTLGDARAGYHGVVRSASEAIQGFTESYKHEKKECDF